MMIQLIYYKTIIFKVHILDKKFKFECYPLGFCKWKDDPSILGNWSYLNQVFVEIKLDFEKTNF